jgi:hypothetical protein
MGVQDRSMDNNPEMCVTTSPTRVRLQIGCKFFNDNTEIIGKPDSSSNGRPIRAKRDIAYSLRS